ncbi:hypothetical protein Droror1_Dr00016971 [Drosera rotundifolia]
MVGPGLRMDGSDTNLKMVQPLQMALKFYSAGTCLVSCDATDTTINCQCTSVLELDVNHTGALMLRAQTLVALKEYQCALFDVNRPLELDSESEVYLNLHSRLKTQLATAETSSSYNCMIAYLPDSVKKNSDHQHEGWVEIPKVNGYWRLDFSHWDRVDDSSEEEEDDDSGDDDADNGDDEDTQPSYMFRVRTVRAL